MKKTFKNLTKFWQQNKFLVLVLGLALGLRLVFLNGSFWLDEAAQAIESQRHIKDQLDIMSDFQPPLIHLLTHFAIYISSSEWWLRLVAATIPGLVTIWATYKIGLILFSENNKKSAPFLALVSTLLLTTSSFHIFYSQELRPYSLPAMWATLSWLSLISFDIKKKIQFSALNFKFKINRSLLTFTLFTILGIYSSYLYPFLAFSQVIYVIWLKKGLFKPLFLGFSIAALSYVPWLPSFYNQLQTGQSWRGILPGWDKVVSIPPFKSMALVMGKFLYGVVNLDLTLVIVGSFLILGLVLLMIYKDFDHKSFWQVLTSFKPIKKQNKNYQILLTLLIWLLVPLISSWLISLIVPVLRPKRVLYLMPAFYLTLTSTYLFAKKKVFAHILVGILLAINLWGTAQYYLNPRLQRENWQHLHQIVTEQYSPHNTAVLFSFPHGFAPWDWYEQDMTTKYPQITTGSLHVDHVPNLTQRLKKVTEYQYVLLFDYLRDLSDPQDKIITELQGYGFVEIDVIDQTNIGFVRVFAQKDSLTAWR
jgi:uncharacterized membrane protein